MLKKMSWWHQLMVVASVVVAFTMATTPAARAEEPIATELDSEGFEDYFGFWELTIDLMGNEMKMMLGIADVDGKLGATLDSARQPEALAIANIKASEEGGLDFNAELKFGNFAIEIDIHTILEDGELRGRIGDKGGLFKSDIVGIKQTGDGAGVVQGKRPSPTEARLRMDGKLVRVTFGGIATDHDDFKRLGETADGEVFTYTSSRATKMLTDASLLFGDILVKTENAAKDYPGVYSLWLKRVGDGWSLVFNEEADTWGTRHEPSADVVEVPLTRTDLEEAVEKFVVKLEQEGDSGLLRMLWGTNEWTAKFSLAQ